MTSHEHKNDRDLDCLPQQRNGNDDSDDEAEEEEPQQGQTQPTKQHNLTTLQATDAKNEAYTFSSHNTQQTHFFRTYLKKKKTSCRC